MGGKLISFVCYLKLFFRTARHQPNRKKSNVYLLLCNYEVKSNKSENDLRERYNNFKKKMQSHRCWGLTALRGQFLKSDLHQSHAENGFGSWEAIQTRSCD